MISEQLESFLTDLSGFNPTDQGKEELEATATKKLITRALHNSDTCINYIICNYTDIDLVQPLLGQLLSLYDKGGFLRYYVLQYVPSLIGCYMVSLSKKQQKSQAMLETFFLSLYNEEILDRNAKQSSMVFKKVEEVRIPSMRYPSIYHDPTKISSLPEITSIRPGGNPSVLSTVRIGPYPTLENFTSESKFIILTRLMKSVNSSMCFISSEVLSRYVCLMALSVALSGFSFPETSFRTKVLSEDHCYETIEDYSRKTRQHVNSALLLEILSGVYHSLYCGAPDLALRAIDAIHQRAQYELLHEVLLVTNAVRNSLLENPLSKEKMDELMWSRTYHKDKRRKDVVTNASLRMKKMPEDIPIQPEQKEKELSKISELVEEGMDHLHDLKKRVTNHAKALKRRKSDAVEVELQTITEEKNVNNGSYKEQKEPEPRIVVPEKSTSSPVHNGQDNGVHGDCSLRDIDDESSEVEDEKGAFTFNGLRHMDSAETTHRSLD